MYTVKVLNLRLKYEFYDFTKAIKCYKKLIYQYPYTTVILTDKTGEIFLKYTC